MVVGNMMKASKSWARLLIIMGSEGENKRVSGIFFKAVVQAVLLLGAEMWVMTHRMGWAMGGFQHKVAQRITDRHPWRLFDSS